MKGITPERGKISMYKTHDRIREPLVILILSRAVPGQPLLVELDDGLRALDVGFPGWHEVRLVAALPLDQEHKLTRGIRGT